MNPAGAAAAGRRAWAWLLSVSLLCWLWFIWGYPHTEAGVAPKHVSSFLVWTILVAWVARTRGFGRRRAACVAAAIGLPVAAVCEVIQFWTPGHSPEWRGMLWSSLGVAVGVAVAQARRGAGQPPEDA